jgi:hypothetical protein
MVGESSSGIIKIWVVVVVVVVVVVGLKRENKP